MKHEIVIKLNDYMTEQTLNVLVKDQMLIINIYAIYSAIDAGCPVGW